MLRMVTVPIQTGDEDNKRKHEKRIWALDVRCYRKKWRIRNEKNDKQGGASVNENTSENINSGIL